MILYAFGRSNSLHTASKYRQNCILEASGTCLRASWVDLERLGPPWAVLCVPKTLIKRFQEPGNSQTRKAEFCWILLVGLWWWWGVPTKNQTFSGFPCAWCFISFCNVLVEVWWVFWRVRLQVPSAVGRKGNRSNKATA